MPTPPIIRHPAKYVPLSAVAIGENNAEAQPVSAANPFPCVDKPLSAIRALIADTVVTPGNAVLVDCSTGGTINLQLSDESQLPLTFAPGVTLMPFAVRAVSSVGTTAQFNAWVLD